MSCLLFHTEEEAVDKISIDELYDRKRQQDLKQISTFSKILNRIHNRINLTARHKKDKHVWFAVPEHIFGESVYSNPDCIAFVITKLTANGFFVKYVHPNTLFISWENYIPSYVRAEFKKRTGNVITEKGVIVDQQDPDNTSQHPSDNSGVPGRLPDSSSSSNKDSRQYTPIKQYKPTGNLVYNPDIFEKIEKKMST
jgi:hypothetical protein